MRAFAALSALAFLIAFQAALVAQEFPYTVTAVDRAPLRAGTNETNEPTAYLAGGTKLEVYRREGNFLAVRPPEGSFSWVRASDVAATGDADVVRVNAAGSQAWVGHQGTDLRAVSQVQLQPGEKLRVLGAIASANNPTVAAWYQIAPPAGEFRFILEQHVQADAPAPIASPPVFSAPVQLASFSAPKDVAAAVAPPSQPVAPAAAIAAPQFASAQLTSAQGLNVDVLPSAATSPVAERLKQIDAQLAAMLAQSPSTWNTTALYTELQTLTATAPTAEQRTQAQTLWWRVAKCQQVQQGYSQISTPSVTPMPRMARTLTATTAPPAQLAPPVAQASAATTINPATGQPLVAPQPQTDFAPLVSRLRTMADQLSANAQQQRQYSSRLRNRNAPSPQLADASTQGTASVLAAAVTEEPAVDAEAEASGYAGTGWLMPLVNRSQLSREGRSGVPPFALTDDDGNVKFLVTPTPGLSVSEYARKKVGVVGPIGQLPNLSNPHLTAQRVVVLDRHE